MLGAVLLKHHTFLRIVFSNQIVDAGQRWCAHKHLLLHALWVSPLTLTGNSDSSDRRTTLGKRRTQPYSTGYEPKGTVVPDEELMQATTP
eukprot:3082477-Amphidinium_carterae.1